MINWESKDQNFIFSLLDKGQTVPISAWPPHLSGEAEYTFKVLEELAGNGKLDRDECNFQLPWEEACNLEDWDKQLLQLPAALPHVLYIDYQNGLSSPENRLNYHICDYAPMGYFFQFQRQGPLVTLEDGREYLLSLEQFRLAVAIDEYNQLPAEAKTHTENLLRFAEIKELSNQSAATLHQYLADENVVVPDKIRIHVDVDPENGDIELSPQIDGIDNDRFTKSFDLFPQAKSQYKAKGGNGERVRVVIPEDQREALQEIKKKYRKIADPELKRKVIEHPEQVFDPELFDFSELYSDRVVELGIYKPKFYPFVCPYKSQWIPGILIDAGPQGKVKITFKTDQDLAEFKAICEEANATGKETFPFNGYEIPVKEAQSIITLGEEQLKFPDKPVEQLPGSGDKTSTSREVLIIKENAELLEYGKESQGFEISQFRFQPIPNLAQGIRLRGHQQEGIAWLQTLVAPEYSASGALLADDMGLGKTLQVLYFIEWYHLTKNTNEKPFLIVAPVSLLENWASEYEKFFTPTSLPLESLYGDQINMFINRQNVVESKARMQQPQILLTNYETLRRYQEHICAVDWAVVILDEAQKVKTPGTLVTNAAKALKADFRIAMTGTPVENTLVDLWCIMDFCVPGLLGAAKDFTKIYQRPQGQKDTDLEALGNQLRSNIGVFLTRRLKTDVIDELPPKHSFPKQLEMPPAQLSRYKLELQEARQKSSEQDGRGYMLKVIQNLRAISDHPFLADESTHINRYPADMLIDSSAKLQLTIQQLEEVHRKREKVILFSDRKATQRMLQRILKSRFGIDAFIINGDTPVKTSERKANMSRQKMLDHFQAQEGFNAIVMSPIAAGFGLNVTAANHVIHYSRHWNPAKEQQATDRVYRIGQEKEVYVYYPMAVAREFKSFDLVLDELLQRKGQLASFTLFPTERVEVRPEELFGGLMTESLTIEEKPLALENLDRLDPNLFESAVAVLFEKKMAPENAYALVTPYSNDKGADVVIESDNQNLLVQAKQSGSRAGNSAVQEISAARAYYQGIYKKPFDLYIVANNGLTSPALELAKMNQIKVVERTLLGQWLDAHPILLSEVHQKERDRQYRI